MSTQRWRIIVCLTTFITKKPTYLHIANRAAVFATYTNWKYSFRIIMLAHVRSFSVSVGSKETGSSYKTFRIRWTILFDSRCLNKTILNNYWTNAYAGFLKTDPICIDQKYTFQHEGFKLVTSFTTFPIFSRNVRNFPISEFHRLYPWRNGCLNLNSLQSQKWVMN